MSRRSLKELCLAYPSFSSSLVDLVDAVKCQHKHQNVSALAYFLPRGLSLIVQVCVQFCINL